MLHDVSKKLRGAGLEDYIMKPPSENKWAVAERAVDKCTLCYHRKEAGAWIPACVEVCPTKARMFGDLDDPHDPAAELVRTGKARHLRPDLGTGGLVYYVIP
jgi:Fe-S-cluster-containing dehydrogenase component